MSANFADTALAMARDLIAEGWAPVGERWRSPVDAHLLHLHEAWARARQDAEHEQRKRRESPDYWIEHPPRRCGFEAYEREAVGLHAPNVAAGVDAEKA